jgi:hypothetical protein
MANEFFVRKGLAIATASVATASGASQSTKYLVVGDDSIVRWATASTTGGGVGTVGPRGATGATGPAGSTGATGPAGSQAIAIEYKFEATTSQATSMSPTVGSFTYWKGTSNAGSGQVVTDLSTVQFISITLQDINGISNEAFFKSLNSYATGSNTTSNVTISVSGTSTTYTVSNSTVKGYLRIRSTTDSTYNLFKVVSRGYYFNLGDTNFADSGPTSPISPQAVGPNGAFYNLAAMDQELANGGSLSAGAGLYFIWVDYVGSTSEGNPSDGENCYIDFSTSLANLYNQVIVASPAFSFQINDGQNPANLAAFGVAQFSSNSLYLNNSSRLRAGTSSFNNTFVGFNAGITMSTGTGNTFVGASAGSRNKTGRCNTFIGNYAGRCNTDAFANTFVGQDAGSKNQLASWNTYIGVGAGFNTITTIATPSNNTFIGGAAGAGVTSSLDSVLVGFGAGSFANNLDHSTFVGVYAGSLTATGSNTFIGAYSGSSNMRGYDNVYVGHDTGVNNTTMAGNSGNNNTFLGAAAGFGPTAGYTASFTTMIGSKAGLNNQADENTFIGAFAGVSNTTGDLNLFLGVNTGACNTTGSRNIYIGTNAGSKGKTSSINTFIGYNSGQNNLADGNTFIGYASGQNNTTGANNFFAGYGAGNGNTTGNGNLFLGLATGLNTGTSTLDPLVKGEFNTFIGTRTGQGNTTGILNTFIGFESGFSDTTPYANVFIGLFAGQHTSSSRESVYIGSNSGQGLSSGNRNNSDFNVFIGKDTGRLKQTGDSNIFIGNSSGRDNTTGRNNVFIGAFSASASNYNNTIAIGAYARPTADNQLVIASTQAPIGTASSGVFSHFLNTKINGIDVKIPIYY